MSVNKGVSDLSSQSIAFHNSRWELWPAEGVAAVVPAAPREGVVAALELSGHLFVGRTSPRHQHHVKARKAKNGNRQDGDECHQAHGNDGLCLCQLIFAVQHVKQREREYAEHVNGERDEEEEEESVVPAPDAVGDPGTMMVKCLNGRVARHEARLETLELKLTSIQ